MGPSPRGTRANVLPFLTALLLALTTPPSHAG